ncbi:Hsp20/alpha crystallin family protein [Actinosynnema pretiosum]|uniref:Hsp20/alpha crystallin family protein n=1 Tax=Actinosynnema pretiosum TaxID=42197 RepID=UPI000B266BD6|nr:Hsp20/alpha crystallin family protein [Actinosynnema pretiosum]
MLMRTDPFRELDRFAQQVLRGVGGLGSGGQGGTWSRPAMMPMDAYRVGDEFVVEFDLPGVAADAIELDVERNVLTVKAERRPNHLGRVAAGASRADAAGVDASRASSSRAGAEAGDRGTGQSGVARQSGAAGQPSEVEQSGLVEMVVSERPLGVFSRQLFLGDALDAENIRADYDAGVLTLRIPISERTKPRKIAIGSAGNRSAEHTDRTTVDATHVDRKELSSESAQTGT